MISIPFHLNLDLQSDKTPLSSPASKNEMNLRLQFDHYNTRRDSAWKWARGGGGIGSFIGVLEGRRKGGKGDSVIDSQRNYRLYKIMCKLDHLKAISEV